MLDIAVRYTRVNGTSISTGAQAAQKKIPILHYRDYGSMQKSDTGS